MDMVMGMVKYVMGIVWVWYRYGMDMVCIWVTGTV